MLDVMLHESEDNYNLERFEREQELAVERTKKESYYEMMKSAQAAKYDVDYVDYDSIDSKSDD